VYLEENRRGEKKAAMVEHFPANEDFVKVAPRELTNPELTKSRTSDQISADEAQFSLCV